MTEGNVEDDMLLTTYRVSPKTLLTFCTNGVLLRTLMTGDAALDVITHVIVVSTSFSTIIQIVKLYPTG